MLIKRFNMQTTALAVTAALTSSTLLAQETKKVSDKDIETIAVTWSTAINSSSMFLKGETIANKQADHISDLLRSIPGVDVGGAHSLNQRITIRSMDDKDLNISIDGANQNTYMYHHMGNLQIHADILKSVDIEVGSNSVINGGLGGSVRFETKVARELLSEEQRFGGRFQVSLANNSGASYSLTNYGLLTDNIDYLAYFNQVNNDNYKVGGGAIKDDKGQVIDGTDGTVRGLESDVTDTLLKFGWDLADNQRLQLGYEKYTDEGNYSYRPDMGLATDLTITKSLEVPLLWPTKLTRDTLTLNYDISFDSTQVKSAIYENTSELWRDETGYAQSPNFAHWAAVNTGEAENTGMNIIAETSLDTAFPQELTYGIDYVKYDTFYQASQTASPKISSEEAKNIALFVQDRIKFNDLITLIPGVRYDSYDIDSSVIDKSFSDASLALALEVQPNDDLLFKLSATQIFKGPEISEVFTGAGLREKQNTDIDAETGINYELSFAYQTTLSDNDSLAFGTTLFETNIDDYIFDYAKLKPRVKWKDNVGDMNIHGYEAYVNYRRNEFNAVITYSSAESKLSAFNQYSSIDGARLDRQQGDTLSATFSYDSTKLGLTLNWETMWVDDVSSGLDLDGASLDNSKKSFSVHNISARWTFDNLTIIAGVDNLFDEYYASQSSRTGLSFHPRFGELYLKDYEPGRNAKVTVSYQF